MLDQIFLTSCLVMMTSCWMIDVNEKNVAIKLSLNVTLDCRNHDYNNNNLGNFKEITKLGILKRNPYNYWVSLAKVERGARHVETPLQNVLLTGIASNLSNSFLKLQFPFATEDTIGQFLCEVEGYYGGNNKMKHIARIRTEPVVIAERDANFHDAKKVILQLKQQNETKNVNDHLFLLLQTMIDLHEKDFEKINHLLEKTNDRTNELIEDIRSINKEDPSQVWPSEGTYSLLQAGTKCPFSWRFDWKFSSVRITTKPGTSNSDRTSHPFHLWHDTLEYNTTTDFHYVNIILCSKTLNDVGPAWPKGSYCIMYYESSCPNGLNIGGLRAGRYDDGSSHDVRVNHYASSAYKSYTYQTYCCRNDGNANTPIELPSRDPFYLFRHGGTCQKVKGMEESNEWIEFDTTNMDNYYMHPNYPDGRINPLRIELCYYKPSV